MPFPELAANESFLCCFPAPLGVRRDDTGAKLGSQGASAEIPEGQKGALGDQLFPSCAGNGEIHPKGSILHPHWSQAGTGWAPCP